MEGEWKKGESSQISTPRPRQFERDMVDHLLFGDELKEKATAEAGRDKSWEELFLSKKETPDIPQEDSSTAGEPKKASSHLSASTDKAPHSYPPLLGKIYGDLSSIWSNILLVTQEIPRTTLLCGATRGEGCTFTSFHLSLFLAVAHDMKVLYADTNLDRPGQDALIPHIQNYPGLASYFADNTPLSSLIMPTNYENLFILPPGSEKSEGGTRTIIFKKKSIEDLMDYCRTRFHVTIFNGQPVTLYPAVIEFAKLVDHVVLVCRYGYSRREVSTLAIKSLTERGVSRIGVVLNSRQYPIPPSIYKILR